MYFDVAIGTLMFLSFIKMFVSHHMTHSLKWNIQNPALQVHAVLCLCCSLNTGAHLLSMYCLLKRKDTDAQFYWCVDAYKWVSAYVRVSLFTKFTNSLAQWLYNSDCRKPMGTALCPCSVTHQEKRDIQPWSSGSFETNWAKRSIIPLALPNFN